MPRRDVNQPPTLRSPDGARRNPGMAEGFAGLIPDYAALHPGYGWVGQALVDAVTFGAALRIVARRYSAHAPPRLVRSTDLRAGTARAELVGAHDDQPLLRQDSAGGSGAGWPAP